MPQAYFIVPNSHLFGRKHSDLKQDCRFSIRVAYDLSVYDFIHVILVRVGVGVIRDSLEGIAERKGCIP